MTYFRGRPLAQKWKNTLKSQKLNKKCAQPRQNVTYRQLIGSVSLPYQLLMSQQRYYIHTSYIPVQRALIKKSRSIGRARKQAGQGKRQGKEIGRAHKQAGQGNRQKAEETGIGSRHRQKEVGMGRSRKQAGQGIRQGKER